MKVTGGDDRLREPLSAGYDRKVEAGADVVDAAHALAQVDLAAARDGGAADRVVAAIGQPLARFDEDWAEGLFLFGDDAKDAAHRMDSLR